LSIVIRSLLLWVRRPPRLRVLRSFWRFQWVLAVDCFWFCLCFFGSSCVTDRRMRFYSPNP
jgi:hypothetical protein